MYRIATSVITADSRADNIDNIPAVKLPAPPCEGERR
jgi:hypothetical protein